MDTVQPIVFLLNAAFKKVGMFITSGVRNYSCLLEALERVTELLDGFRPTGLLEKTETLVVFTVTHCQLKQLCLL